MSTEDTKAYEEGYKKGYEDAMLDIIGKILDIADEREKLKNEEV